MVRENPANPIRRGTVHPGVRFCWVVLLAASLMAIDPVAGLSFANAQSTITTEGRALQLGTPGYVVITAGLDSTLGFAWHLGPGPGRRSLTWGHGSLSLPDTMELESLREIDLLIPCTADLAGLGASGRLAFEDGIFTVSEPVHLSDGILEIHLTAGTLEVLGERVRYTAPVERGSDPKAGYIFLAGMMLLVVVLLRRVALRKRNPS